MSNRSKTTARKPACICVVCKGLDIPQGANGDGKYVNKCWASGALECYAYYYGELVTVCDNLSDADKALNAHAYDALRAGVAVAEAPEVAHSLGEFEAYDVAREKNTRYVVLAEAEAAGKALAVAEAPAVAGPAAPLSLDAVRLALQGGGYFDTTDTDVIDVYGPAGFLIGHSLGYLIDSLADDLDFNVVERQGRLVWGYVGRTAAVVLAAA